MDDGNVSRIIVWVADTAIVKKQLDGKTFYFVADAVTGKPVAEGQRRVLRLAAAAPGRQPLPGRSPPNFAETTDADGQVMPDPTAT